MTETDLDANCAENVRGASNTAFVTEHKPQHWNDAEVIGDLDSSEARGVLDSKIEYMSARSTRTPGSEWRPNESTVEAFLEETLTTHPASEQKEGKTICYATAPVRTGHDRDTQEEVCHTFRIKRMMSSVTAIAIDVDGTAKVEAVLDRLLELGWFAVIYTTHSYVEKWTPDGDRLRVIIFLTEPFRFPAWQKDQTLDDLKAHKAALDEYASIYVGVCDMLGLDEVDGSALSPNQMMYPPRRPKGADFKHYVLAGSALDLGAITPGDASKFLKGMGGAGKTSAKVGSESAPPFLSDSFDIAAWWEDGGRYFPIETGLDLTGWEDRGPAGGGRNILCFNDAAHSNAGDPTDTGTWACENDDDFVITCLHDHCRHLTTWDFIRLWEENILADVVALPDEYETLSDLLCDSDLYPIVDGEEFQFDKHDYGVPIPIDRLTTARRVERAFNVLPADAGKDRIAALYAGVEFGGGKAAAMAKLEELVKGLDHVDHNTRKAIKRAGSDMWKAHKAAYAADKHEEEKEKAVAATQRDDLAHPSMDIAEPLGNTAEESMATLGKRHALVDIQGKFRVLRKPDLDVLRARDGVMKSVITASTVPDFKAYHSDRRIKIGDELVNPAALFVETQKRYSDVVFAPYPAYAGPNDFNMYYGRTLEPVEGNAGIIPEFIKDVICAGREDVFAWVILHLAHMVQRPGEKPGTALVCYGPGGAGKGTFGDIVTELTKPHAKTIDQEEHLLGRFAGEHLSTCIFAHIEEAVFPSGKNSSAIKNLVTATTMLVEPKGLPVMDMPSYLRCYFEGNEEIVVPIEGNGSERRYLVMKVNGDRRGDKEYFKTLREQISGPQMQAFLHDLEHYVPEDHGFTWNDVRTAPETPERLQMQFQTMRASARALLDMLDDGEVTLTTPEGAATYTFNMNTPTRIPSGLLREYLGRRGNKHNADGVRVW